MTQMHGHKGHPIEETEDVFVFFLLMKTSLQYVQTLDKFGANK